MPRFTFFVLTIACLCSHSFAFSPALPTDNDALFRQRPEDFYMFVDRDFEGKKSTPWNGGKYGFSRSPQRFGNKVALTKFHEGIDIKPLRRDAAGEPLDNVRAIESGKVVHTSNVARDSNYGKYVVIQHNIANSPVYSIYAHLATVDVSPGQTVQKGTRLGRLGYTGAGIDKRRAHVHLEIAVMWNDAYERWHALHFTEPNKHSIFNGMNLMGLDTAEFYLAQKRNPDLTLQEFVASQPTFFRVQIPASPHFQLPTRYPWLVRGDASKARSWIVSLTAVGFPTAIEASSQAITTPNVVWAKPSEIPYAKATRSLLSGSSNNPQLGDSGKKLIQLLSMEP